MATGFRSPGRWTQVLAEVIGRHRQAKKLIPRKRRTVIFGAFVTRSTLNRAAPTLLEDAGGRRHITYWCGGGNWRGG